MQHRVLLGILVLAAAVQAAPATAAVKQGPPGDAFYTPPSSLPSAHGTPIWQRKLTGPAVLKGAKSNTLLLYRSTSVAGRPVAESGSVAVPKGKPPKGGWPVISWAHGTTGIADQCAPTRALNNQDYTHKLLQSWLKHGYAVVATDYEGLGTPGEHPFLVGVSAGRSVLDMALAARKLNPDLGKALVISGHSQGGHAALWAASLAPKWAPSESLKGTLAFAPANHIGEQASLLPALTAPSGLSGLAAMIVAGANIGRPDLGIPALLSDQAAALFPQIDTKCLPELSAPDSFGGVAPANLLKPGANVAAINAYLGSNDPEDLTIKGPIQVEQGTADQTVLPNFTDQLAGAYQQRHLKLTYKTYNGLDHGSVVTNAKSEKDATAFIAKAFK